MGINENRNKNGDGDGGKSKDKDKIKMKIKVKMVKLPLYCLEALLFGIAFLLIYPLGIQYGSSLGGFLARKIGKRTRGQKIAHHNLHQAFPEKTKGEIDEIINSMWDNIGRTFFEFLFFAPKILERFENYVTIENDEPIKNAFAQNKGVLFLGMHFGNWELSLTKIAKDNIATLYAYRNPNNPFLAHILRSRRHLLTTPKDQKKSFGIDKRRGLLPFIRALKNKQPILIPMDQKVGTGEKIGFFGREAWTSIAPSKLALQFQMPMILCAVERKKGVSFTSRFIPISTPQTTNNKQKDGLALTTHINQQIEKEIRRNPSQWFWVHNRWQL